MLYDNNMKTEPYTTTRIWKKILKKLRLIAALMDTSMVAILEQLAEEQLQRLQDQPKGT